MASTIDIVTLPSIYNDIYDVNGDGRVFPDDALAMLKHATGQEKVNKVVSGVVKIDSQNPKNCFVITKDGQLVVSIGVGGINTEMCMAETMFCGRKLTSTSDSFEGIILDGISNKIKFRHKRPEGYYTDGTTITPTSVNSAAFNNISLAELKRNIKEVEVEKIYDIVRNSTIYNFNYKTEADNSKQHTGFIIGENYKTPREVIGQDEKGIDLYSMCSILWKAMQELLTRVEKLEGGKSK